MLNKRNGVCFIKREISFSDATTVTWLCCMTNVECGYALRVRATMLGRFKEDKISALLPNVKSNQATIEIQDDRASICNGKIRCEVLATGKITFYEVSSGKVLLKEYDRNRFRRQK